MTSDINVEILLSHEHCRTARLDFEVKPQLTESRQGQSFSLYRYARGGYGTLNENVETSSEGRETGRC